MLLVNRGNSNDPENHHEQGNQNKCPRDNLAFVFPMLRLLPSVHLSVTHFAVDMWLAIHRSGEPVQWDIVRVLVDVACFSVGFVWGYAGVLQVG
jgi:hypothetical protein